MTPSRKIFCQESAKNQKDLVEMPARIRRQVQIVAVNTMAEVLERALLPALPDARPARAAAGLGQPKPPDVTSPDEV